MELLMKNIHMWRLAKQADTMITLDEDLNVPDVNPDVDQIIQSRERVVLEHFRAEKNKCSIDGYMAVSILYMDDTKEKNLHRLETRLRFTDTIHMDGLEADDSVSIKCWTEDLKVSLINSRKLAIRGLLSVRATVEEMYDLSAAAETKTDILICEKRKKMELMQLSVHKKDIYRLKEELHLPANKPDMLEVLWESIQLRGCRVTVREQEVKIEGKLSLFLLYKADDENRTVQSFEQTIPFDGILECSGCRERDVPDIEASLSQTELSIREDEDGEKRILHLEGVLELDIRVYATEEAEILEDVYSPARRLIPETSEELYESLVMRNESKCKTTGKIRIQSAKPRILQICYVVGSVKIDQTKQMENGLLIEGAVPVSILYISSDDTIPFAVLEGTIPFSHTADITNLDANCRYTLRAGLEQLSATMADSETIDVKLEISLNIFVARVQKQRFIHRIQEEAYPMEELEAVPGFTGYIVQEGETLWDIAKKYFLTPEQIMKMNQLENEEIKKGDCLILMKSIMV